MSLQAYPLKRTETLEVPINNTSSPIFKFTDNETTLDNIVVTGIVINSEAVSQTFSGKSVVPDAIAKKAFITLADSNNNQLVKRLPLEVIMQDQKFFLELNRLRVDVRKSFIELQDKTGLTTNHAFLVTFFYEKAGD